MRRWLGCVGGSMGGLIVLHRLGPVFRDGHDGVVVAMGVLRLTAMAAGCWLLLLAVLDGLARMSDIRPLQRLSERVTPAAFRELLGAGAGAGMASMAALGILGPPPPVAQPHAANDDTSIIMRQLPDEEPPKGTARMEVITDAPTTTITAPAPEPQPVGDPAPPPAPTRQPEPSGESTWVVEPGESFWVIAADHLEDELGRPPSDREIVGYWTNLIEANRAGLPDPANPDLLFAGHVLTLPAV